MNALGGEAEEPMNRINLHARSLVFAACTSAAFGCVSNADEDQPLAETEDELHSAYEVWLVDQSNSADTFGGRIYIYAGQELSGDDPSSAVPTDVINLGLDTATLCFNATGANPVRPHMLLFNR